MWGAARALKGVTAKTVLYNTATMGGQSGAPVYIKRNGQRYVIGIHNYGSSTGNTATRITRPVYDRLLAWSKL
jgi:V8-like Glu-specific endopeptidase